MMSSSPSDQKPKSDPTVEDKAQKSGNWEISPKSTDSCHSMPFNATYCNGEMPNKGSKLYGFPKRRKVSAIRDFPAGCGILAKDTLNGCPETPRDLLLSCESVIPEAGTNGYTYTTKDHSSSTVPKMTTGEDMNTMTLSIEKNSVDVNAIEKPLDKIVMPSTERKNPSTEDVIEKLLDTESEKTVNIGKGEENISSTNWGISKSQSQTGSKSVENDSICRSILYGYPNRRKISAIRDFPSGCGASTVIVDREQSEVHSFPIQKNLEVSMNDSVESLPLGEEYGSKAGEEENRITSERSESKQSLKKVLTVAHEGTDTSKTTDNLREKVSRLGKIKQKMDSTTSRSSGDGDVKKVIKKIPSPLTKIVKKSGEVKDAHSFDNDIEGTSNKLPLDMKPLQIVTPRDSGKTPQLGNKSPVVKVCSNEKVIKEHVEKGAGVELLRDKSRDTGNVNVRKSKGSKLLQVVARDELESDPGNLKRKSAGDRPGSSGKSRNDRLPVDQHMDEKMDLEALGEKIIVLGLMAEPNCPWRYGRGSVMSGRGASTSAEKSKRTRKVNKRQDHSNLSAQSQKNLSTQLQLVPVGDEDQELALDGQLLDDDRNEMVFSESPVSRKINVTVPLHGLVPVSSSSTGMEGDEVTRNRVRRTLRLFQVICRKLSQEEESKVKGQGKVKRVDLDAAKILRERNEFVNAGKAILGAVPGVEIGDEFHYRSELTVIGLHRLYQGGIDYLKIENKVYATSIVSGGNEDEVEGSDVLIYSGSGGSAATDGKPPEDQKLERGNLSLKNSMEAQKPVRVIRGSKELKTDPRDGRPKTFSTYVYDGLYLVEKYWKEKVQQGYFAFKFQLKRVPGQPELPLKEVKKSGKSSSRPGVCIKDISEGKEAKPICVVNTIDDERPLPFKYITKIRYPLSCVHAPPKGCDCTDGCSDSEKCACAVKNGGEIPFTYNGLIVQAKPLVYECGPSCKCSASCHNRVSQHGVKIQLEIFKTKMSGWGVRSLSSIPSGSFVCEYVGELLPDGEAEQRSNSDEYLFDIGNNYDDASLWDGLPSVMLPSNATDIVEDSGFAIDACLYGSVARFVNHSCSPNLYAQSVLYDNDDRRMPHIMLFAAENIPPLQELTYHYNYKIGQVRDKDGNIKRKDCYCGSQECVGRLY